MSTLPVLDLYISHSPLLRTSTILPDGSELHTDALDLTEAQANQRLLHHSLPTSSSSFSMELASLSSFTSSLPTLSAPAVSKSADSDLSTLEITKPFPSHPPPLISPDDVLFLLDLLDKADVDVAHQVNQLKESIRETHALVRLRRCHAKTSL